ncbi:MAG: nucleotidyltransferase [Candidatus Firestonebacteria bacterium]|nr:nucleotidyltransferase [Candidatus Firestonebacteria bacterium]
MLELGSLIKAIQALGRALNVSNKAESSGTASPDEKETIRSGVIQNFKFTYELCWKFMKRWIEEHVSSGIVDGVPRNELFRVAAENRLIENVEAWMEFHKARNKTSHIYDEAIAAVVYQAAISFLPAAKALQKNLESRNA